MRLLTVLSGPAVWGLEERGAACPAWLAQEFRDPAGPKGYRRSAGAHPWVWGNREKRMGGIEPEPAAQRHCQDVVGCAHGRQAGYGDPHCRACRRLATPARQLDARGWRPFPAMPGSTTGRVMVKPQLPEPGLARPDRKCQCRCSGGPIAASAQRRQPRWRLRRDHAAAWSAARAARRCDVLATSPRRPRISS